MSGALAARSTDKEFEKGRVERTKVKRYRAGEVPDWADAADKEAAAFDARRPHVAAPVIIKKTDDPRLRRLAENGTVDRDEAIQRHREIRAAQIVKRRHEEEDEEKPGITQAEIKEEEADEEELLKRRQAVRERLLAQQKAQEEAAAAQRPAADEEDEDEEESEYETDSEEEEQFGRPRLVKPVFVPKGDRDTIAERERLEREEEEAAEREKRRKEERKSETRLLVHEVIAQEKAALEAQANGPAVELEDVDTGDENEEEEYAGWKKREMARIKRDRDTREAAEKEAELREKLRNMTDEERAAWERDNPKEQAEAKPKKKWGFMQKYWHVGAYYQTEADDTRGTAGGDEIFKRDYSAPTGEDKLNKSILPKVMQVKNFGRSGRSKWTHLVDQDTTRDREDAFNTADEVRARMLLQKHQQQELKKPKKFQQ